jgi:hypothetical protein
MDSFKLFISTLQKLFVALMAMFLKTKIPALQIQNEAKVQEVKLVGIELEEKTQPAKCVNNFETNFNQDDEMFTTMKLLNQFVLIDEDYIMERNTPNLFNRGYVSKTTFKKFIEKNKTCIYLYTSDREKGFERVIPKTAPGINTFLSKTSQNFFKPWHDVMMEGIQVTNQEREFIVAKPREWKP